MTDKQLKQKMRRLACLADKMWGLSREIEREFEARGLHPDIYRDSGGCSLEELEAGNDITDELFERLIGIYDLE